MPKFAVSACQIFRPNIMLTAPREVAELLLELAAVRI
jgi:hypothetical protein